MSIWLTLSVLTFLNAGLKCVYTCMKHFCVIIISFRLVCCFIDKELETTSRRFVCFNFIFNINAQIVQYLIKLTFEVRMIYVHLSFFLWFLLIPYIHVKERKMKNWKNVNYFLAKKPKDKWSSHVTGKRSIFKYRNRRTTKLLSIDSLFKNYFFSYNYFFCFSCFPLAQLARAVCSPPHFEADFPFNLHFSHGRSN